MALALATVSKTNGFEAAVALVKTRVLTESTPPRVRVRCEDKGEVEGKG
jgi:hypothetical protein